MKLITLILLAAASAGGQSTWRTSRLDNSSSLGDREVLTLRGSYLPSAGIARPSVILVCRDGKLLSSSFNTSLSRRVSRAALVSGSQKLSVSIRITGKRDANKEWKSVDGNGSFQPDLRFVKDLVTAGVIDVYFSTPAGFKVTAEFQPSSADSPRVIRECGIH